MSAFLCNGCGACCRRVRMVRPDWPVRADGACVHLTQDNRCAIYATRPLICRVDESRPMGVSLERWHQLNSQACEQMQREDRGAV